MIYRRTPKGNLLGVKMYNCSVCGTRLWRSRTPRGGRFVPAPTTTTINGESVTVATNNGQGCWFCMSPHSDGGKGGDLLRPWRK